MGCAGELAATEVKRFHFNNFKYFSLSFQSALHLSLTVLVCYRSLTEYLALGEEFITSTPIEGLF